MGLRFGLALLAGFAAASLQQAEGAARPPDDLKRFVGAKAGQSEGGLSNLGYEAVKTVGLTGFWWNAGNKVCARIVTANGRLRSITEVSPFQCGQRPPAAASRPAPAEPGRKRGGVAALAQLACKSAVARTAHRSFWDMNTRGAVETPEGFEIMVRFKGADRPWACKTDPGGKVRNVMYTGEG